MKYVHHSGTTCKCYCDFITEKKPMGGERLSQLQFLWPWGGHRECWENRFPSPGWKLLSRQLPVRLVDRWKISRTGNRALFIWRYWNWRNNTFLDAVLKQIITAQVAKWGLTTRQKWELRADWWLGDRTSCNVSFWFPHFSETHLVNVWRNWKAAKSGNLHSGEVYLLGEVNKRN